MATCKIHPALKSVGKVNGVECCEKCRDGIAAAVKKVDKHVEPKGCFVWFEGRNGWQPIPGTGCAHWVAHQRGIKRGGAGEQCMLGFPFRVATMVGGKSEVKVADVKVNDIYVTPSKDHTGLVIKVTPDPKNADVPKIVIRHDSIAQGKVAENEYATHFKGAGKFYR